MTRSEAWLRLIGTLKIRTRDRKVIPLHYNVPQQMVWQRAAPKIDRGQALRFIILKARREGISTEIESWLMAFIATGDLVNALVMAHVAKATRRIWNMSKFMVSSSPLLNSMGIIGQHSISFGRSTLDVSTAGSPEAERSADLTAIHLSEVAFFPHQEALVAVMQTMPPPHIFSIGILESTANGKSGDGEMFYNEWTRAVAGESEWVPVFLSCLDFPENQLPGLVIEELDAEEEMWREALGASDAQIAWRRWAIANLCQGSIDRMHQEHPVTADEAFIASGLPFFRTEHLLPMEAHIRRGIRGTVDVDGRFTASPTGWLEVFVPPRDGHQYVLGADSSFGMAGDEGTSKHHSRSAGEVLDMETMEQVAEYDASSAPHIMARHLAGIGRYYHTALIAPEVQASGGGGGREIIVYLRDLEYWNLHRWKQPDRVQPLPGHMYGWETNSRTRPRMLARIREVVMERSAVIHSKRLLSQLASFGENDSGRMEALAGRDDLLFAYGIALMSRSENFFRIPSGEAYAMPTQEPDWRAMGLHVIRPEDPYARLKRLLALAGTESRDKTFMEL